MSERLMRTNIKLARSRWKQDLDRAALRLLKTITSQYQFSIAHGDLLWLSRTWYVTHTGLIRLARRHRCAGIHTRPVNEFCSAQHAHWTFETTVYRSKTCRGFVGYGDADPSNTSPLVHGAEMRVSETRAVNRALRKAYGIGICSVEEVDSFVSQSASQPDSKKPPQPADGNGNFGGRTVRDRLCLLIRQHQLDAALVKSYATDFCGVKILRDATRDQVENFVTHLADWAEKDRNALLCQLNSYSRPERGAA